jgi:hypothetical protein
MKTELSPDKLKVLKSELKRAGANMWIPENCSNSTCTFNRDGWCGLNNCQRQTCDVWAKPTYAPKPAVGVALVLTIIALVAAVLAAAVLWVR